MKPGRKLKDGMKGFDRLFKTAMHVAVFSLFLSVFVAPVHAGYWFRYDDDVQGKIVDKDTRQPLEGVVVMAMWVTEFSRITIEPGENYYDYFETRTDANEPRPKVARGTLAAAI